MVQMHLNMKISIQYLKLNFTCIKIKSFISIPSHKDDVPLRGVEDIDAAVGACTTYDLFITHPKIVDLNCLFRATMYILYNNR